MTENKELTSVTLISGENMFVIFESLSSLVLTLSAITILFANRKGFEDITNRIVCMFFSPEDSESIWYHLIMMISLVIHLSARVLHPIVLALFLHNLCCILSCQYFNLGDHVCQEYHGNLVTSLCYFLTTSICIFWFYCVLPIKKL
jgi:hypothetical protein